MSEPVSRPRQFFRKTSRIAALVSIVPACLAATADFDVRDGTAFKRIVPPDARLERLATGLKFTEGPV